MLQIAAANNKEEGRLLSKEKRGKSFGGGDPWYEPVLESASETGESERSLEFFKPEKLILSLREFLSSAREVFFFCPNEAKLITGDDPSRISALASRRGNGLNLLGSHCFWTKEDDWYLFTSTYELQVSWVHGIECLRRQS
ncbi:hypothetical protein L3X38_010290 [Prunus dulcis]|uniref:Uncharacterized protein n=1 Tax=Prunus dulcis TaxID=3755 RepID=A0AAD4ZDW1_PRUDU|nr:hypothetical protein L3X38_010290 [Prunus dulcis]